MARLKRLTESLNDDAAQTIDSAVLKAQRNYTRAVNAALDAAQELSSLQDEAGTATEDEIAARQDKVRSLQEKVAHYQAKQAENYTILMAALQEKRQHLLELCSQTDEQVNSLSQTQDSGELATAKTDQALLQAALSDVEAKIKDIEKKQQGRKVRNPAPKRTSRKGSAEVKNLSEEIAAILAEADKVKTNQENKPQSTVGRYRLKAKYNEVVIPELTKKFNYTNVNEVPKLEKILLNMGLGDVKDDAKKFNAAVEELKVISGQKPITTTAKKSVANFKVRQGMAIGAKVTLRGNRMYEFLDKLISIALPRVRDFKGVNPNSFDGRGNYAMGIKEQLIFPEIKYDKIDKVRGFDVVIVTSAKTDEEAKELLKLLGMPFKA